ncbi:MAG: terpene cyclase/mutase family protein [Deltaproteobacteria bacterium]|nr:terpene cyclase/mutase family protein [Deltaproteobacteria bacterium]
MSTVSPETVQPWLEELIGRLVPEKGWPVLPGKAPRPDATAWVALTLASWGRLDKDWGKALDLLTGFQRSNGSLPVFASQPEATWPTSLAVMAWSASKKHEASMQRALDYLLKIEIRHVADPAIGHALQLRGWPWIAETHPWVEPSCMGLLALSAAGREDPRSDEALRMLLNRQLEAGGWNYGNTKVFGATLRPQTGPSGLALMTLAGRTEMKKVAHSIRHLRQQVEQTRSPRSLGLVAMGLRAWSPEHSFCSQLVESLSRQDFGPVPSDHLSIALCALSGQILPGVKVASLTESP